MRFYYFYRQNKTGSSAAHIQGAMQIKQRVSLKNIITLLGAVVFLVFSVKFVLIQAETITPAFKARMAKKARSLILIRDAKELNPTYESILSSPYKGYGKARSRVS